jgi:hypothetical protein
VRRKYVFQFCSHTQQKVANGPNRTFVGGAANGSSEPYFPHFHVTVNGWFQDIENAYFSI